MPIALPLFVSLGLLTTMSCLSIGLAVALPPGTQLPIHFDFSATPSAYASAVYALSALPVAGIVALVVFSIGPRVDKRIERSPALYLAIWLGTMLVLALAHGMIIRGALFALKAAAA